MYSVRHAVLRPTAMLVWCCSGVRCRCAQGRVVQDLKNERYAVNSDKHEVLGDWLKRYTAGASTECARHTRLRHRGLPEISV